MLLLSLLPLHGYCTFPPTVSPTNIFLAARKKIFAWKWCVFAHSKQNSRCKRANPFILLLLCDGTIWKIFIFSVVFINFHSLAAFFLHFLWYFMTPSLIFFFIKSKITRFFYTTMLFLFHYISYYFQYVQKEFIFTFYISQFFERNKYKKNNVDHYDHLDHLSRIEFKNRIWRSTDHKIFNTQNCWSWWSTLSRKISSHKFGHM